MATYYGNLDLSGDGGAGTEIDPFQAGDIVVINTLGMVSLDVLLLRGGVNFTGGVSSDTVEGITIDAWDLARFGPWRIGIQSAETEWRFFTIKNGIICLGIGSGFKTLNMEDVYIDVTGPGAALYFDREVPTANWCSIVIGSDIDIRVTAVEAVHDRIIYNKTSSKGVAITSGDRLDVDQSITNAANEAALFNNSGTLNVTNHSYGLSFSSLPDCFTETDLSKFRFGFGQAGPRWAVASIGVSPIAVRQGDVRLFPDPIVNTADVSIENRDLARDAGLETAVMISLFTNRQAEPEDLLPDENSDRQGWWADSLNMDGDKTGSRLWLLQRSKTIQEIPAAAEGYAREALQWMIDDNVASIIEVTVTRLDYQTLSIAVEITSAKGEQFLFKYVFNWKEQLARRTS